MGWNTLTQVTPVVIVGGPPGSGLFIYNGTPTFGNLIQSVTTIIFSGSDLFGNGIVGGDTVYFSSGPTFYAVRRVGDVIADVWSSLSPGGPYASVTGLNIAVNPASGGSFIITANTTGINGALTVSGGPLTSTGGTAGTPTVVTTDTWQTMTLLASWTATGGYAQYQLRPDGTVRVRGIITPGTLTDGTTIWHAPAGYVNSSPGTQLIPTVITAGSGSVGFLTPRLGASAAGTIFIENIPAGTTQIEFNGSYSLT